MGLTMLRLLLLPVFLYLLLLDAHEPPPHAHRWWAVAVFAVMAVTDKLDGWLARRLNQSSKLGALLDPVADKLLIASSVVLLHFDWIAPPLWAVPTWVVLAIYGKDLLVVIGTVALLAVAGNVAIKARLAGKLSTVLQLALVILTMIGPDLNSAGWALRILHSLWWTVAAIAVVSCVDYLAQGTIAFVAHRKTPAEVPSLV